VEGRDDIERLVAHIRQAAFFPGLREAKMDPPYTSLPLCAIDAVFSLGAHYESVVRTVRTWCEAQTPPWQVYGPGGELRISDFLSAVHGQYGRDFQKLAEAGFKNRQRTSPRNGTLKAKAVVHFAEVLQRFGIETLSDAATAADNQALRNEIKKIRGQTSGLSFDYFLMLSGHDDYVKADTMLRRFVANAVGVSFEKMTFERTQFLVRAAADSLKPEVPELTVNLLDNQIWKYQRRQPASET